MIMQGRGISPGIVEGTAIVSKSPLSFYGGIDPKTGIVIEKGHELEGKCVSGKILVFPNGKGSTVGSYVIYGLKKYGKEPLAIINQKMETIVATGVILAGIPAVDSVEISRITEGAVLRVDGTKGTVEIVE
ncbi:MAG: DUF126 domain-containing protein [Thermoplasmata archaeon]|nr:DUF126 domain-containing protein [Thermoplasmata archaeon]